MSDVQPATDAEVDFARVVFKSVGTDIGVRILARLDAATARIAELEREAAQWQAAAQQQIARSEALEDYVERHDFIGGWRTRAETAERKLKAAREALERAERKLSAYVGVCKGDTELTKTVLPMTRAALAMIDKTGGEG
jgi:outer membrane protein TolC